MSNSPTAIHDGWPFERLGQLVLAAIAIASLAYAAATAPGRSDDLLLFQQGGQNWVDGDHSFAGGPGHLYPPFALPLFWPMTLVSFDLLKIIWLVVNLFAAGAVIVLSGKLFGDRWPARMLFYLAAIVASWAPFRVTLRMGQLSLVITALLLGSLVARRNGRRVLAGLLIGLSLVKYPMTLPFFLYLIWKREWKITALALAVVGALTIVASSHLGMSPIQALMASSQSAMDVYTSPPGGFVGATGLKLLVFSLTGNIFVTNVIRITLVIIALAGMAWAFARTPGKEALHLATLSFFALWFAYHGIYDSVLCAIPAAVFIDFLVSHSNVIAGRVGLATLGLFTLSIPGFLTERLHLDPHLLSGNPFGWLALHIERLAVFGLFCGLVVLTARVGASREKEQPAIERRQPSAEPASETDQPAKTRSASKTG